MFAENWFGFSTMAAGQYQHAWVIPQAHAIEFYVRACSDAFVLLTSRIFDIDYKVYQIEFGTNVNSR